ncbi:MAG: sulfite exporter TauE/SafE family protein [Oscillospiraceae bacterium]
MSVFIGILAGIFTSMGLGGGFILILYLNIIKELPPLEIALINLIFFIPTATISAITHAKNNLIKKEFLLSTSICGILGAILGVIIATYIDTSITKNLFAILILAFGIKELFSKEEVYKKE